MLGLAESNHAIEFSAFRQSDTVSVGVLGNGTEIVKGIGADGTWENLVGGDSGNKSTNGGVSVDEMELFDKE